MPDGSAVAVSGIIDLRSTLNGNYSKRDLSAIRWICIHHTGHPANSTPEEINAYHKSLGWGGIGYHCVVRQSGQVYYCGDVGTKRANVYGLNGVVVGIVLCGEFSQYYPLPTQLAGAKRAIAFVRGLLGRNVPVKAHYEIALPESPTACPGANTWPGWRELL